MSRYVDADELLNRVVYPYTTNDLQVVLVSNIERQSTEDVKPIVIEELEKIKAEIDVMYDSNNYTDEFEHGIMSVREIINKHISELRKESEAEE